MIDGNYCTGTWRWKGGSKWKSCNLWDDKWSDKEGEDFSVKSDWDGSPELFFFFFFFFKIFCSHPALTSVKWIYDLKNGYLLEIKTYMLCKTIGNNTIKICISNHVWLQLSGRNCATTIQLSGVVFFANRLKDLLCLIFKNVKTYITLTSHFSNIQCFLLATPTQNINEYSLILKKCAVQKISKTKKERPKQVGRAKHWRVHEGVFRREEGGGRGFVALRNLLFQLICQWRSIKRRPVQDTTYFLWKFARSWKHSLFQYSRLAPHIQRLLFQFHYRKRDGTFRLWLLAERAASHQRRRKTKKKKKED